MPEGAGHEQIGGLRVEAGEQRLDRRDIAGIRPVGDLRRYAMTGKMFDEALCGGAEVGVGAKKKW